MRLAGEIDWDFLARRFSSVCRVGPGQPPLPTRLVAGLFILKHMHNLSDEALCERWVENPYFQYFCGEVVFRHELPFDRSSLTRWRQRLGEEQIAALLQESLSVAHRTGAIDTKDLERVAIDTTVQEKAIAHPTDARLTHRAIEKLVELAKREGRCVASQHGGRAVGGSRRSRPSPAPAVGTASLIPVVSILPVVILRSPRAFPRRTTWA